MNIKQITDFLFSPKKKSEKTLIGTMCLSISNTIACLIKLEQRQNKSKLNSMLTLS